MMERVGCGLVLVLLGLMVLGCDRPRADARVRRDRLATAADAGAAGLPALQLALQDEQVLVRRTAARLLAASDAPAARAILLTAMADGDPLVRRTVVVACGGLHGPADVERLASALRDPDLTVRETVVRLLAAAPRDARVTALLDEATRDPDASVQRLAREARASFRPVAPERTLLRERPDMADHLPRIVTCWSRQLPAAGWRYRQDAKQEGHTRGWNATTVDPQGWHAIAIEEAWQPSYVGLAWYRLTFELPERPEHLASELVFEGVDESAWVWINGSYVGGHDIGPAGWNQPFRLDVTPELRWGATNTLAVRVLNSALAGGIWRPVRLESLRLK